MSSTRARGGSTSLANGTFSATPAPTGSPVRESSARKAFCALIGTSTLLQDGHHTGVARTAGVSVAGLLAWRRAPFVLVLMAAASTTATERVLGTPVMSLQTFDSPLLENTRAAMHRVASTINCHDEHPPH
jgi:hypothetical protein